MMTKTKADKYPQRVRNELRFRELTVLRVGAQARRSSVSCWEARRWKASPLTALTTIPSFFPRAGRGIYPAAGDRGGD